MVKSVKFLKIGVICGVLALGSSGTGFGESAARIWNEQILNAIRKDIPNPPVHARNLFHLSGIMYDIWAAFERDAAGYLHREKVPGIDINPPSEQDRELAIHYAAYKFLSTRYEKSVRANETRLAFDAQMSALGISTDAGSMVTFPALLAQSVVTRYLEHFREDGSFENGDGIVDWFFGLPFDLDYHDSSYVSMNEPYLLLRPFQPMEHPNHWQPLAFELRVTQNGIETDEIQTFLGAQWGDVVPFALESSDRNDGVYFDPGTPPQLGGDGDQLFKDLFTEVVEYSSLLDPKSEAVMDISPASIGNNPLGTNDGTGYSVNPYTGEPYRPQIRKVADFGRVLAEFWADGPDSETPPGHWNTLANEVSDHPALEKRIFGDGDVVDDLEWDVKLYFALNAAVHDAAVVAWGCKRKYDYVRPVTAIRHMGYLGQSSDPNLPAYHAQGLPLVPGLVELVTEESSKPGERHQALNYRLGHVVIKAWTAKRWENGELTPGVEWIDPTQWFPYQRQTFVTPAFPGYVSGHSVFSRSAAEVLTRFTGSKYFPGGMGSFTARKNEFLQFDEGPSEEVVLQWATYYDASDQAGLSRMYGGIHVSVDDFPGRIMGSLCGAKTIDFAKEFFNNTVLEHANEKLKLTSVSVGTDNQVKIEFPCVTGIQYQVESTADFNTFAPVTEVLTPETDRVTVQTPVDSTTTAVFFRIKAFQ